MLNQQGLLATYKFLVSLSSGSVDLLSLSIYIYMFLYFLFTLPAHVLSSCSTFFNIFLVPVLHSLIWSAVPVLLSWICSQILFFFLGYVLSSCSSILDMFSVPVLLSWICSQFLFFHLDMFSIPDLLPVLCSSFHVYYF